MFSRLNRRIGQWLARRAGNADEFARVQIVGDAIDLHAAQGGAVRRVPLVRVQRIAVADVSVVAGAMRAAWFELDDGGVLTINAGTLGWSELWAALPAHLPISRDVCMAVLLGANPALGVVFESTSR
jgi:hypothetical protein